uniref:Uncharacterized protein n=1 Tax=Eptatretus burgeri TaxID=7764 RepID=A0A8C4N2Q5_EPTBU
MPISLCSDRFPHRCLMGFIRVIRAVILSLPFFFYFRYFGTTTSTTNIALTKRISTTTTTFSTTPTTTTFSTLPTAFQPQPPPTPQPPSQPPSPQCQPQPQSPKSHLPQYPTMEQHRFTFNSAGAAIFAPATARSLQTNAVVSLFLATVISTMSALPSASMIPATSARSKFRLGIWIRRVRGAEPVGVIGESAEIRSRLTNPTKRRAERQFSQSGGVEELRRSLELAVGGEAEESRDGS